jgi:small-conductance mechanosensitive channel
MESIGQFLIDLIWPCSVHKGSTACVVEPAWPELSFEDDTAEVAYEILKDEHNAENDRMKTVETKLISISSLAPVAMAVVVTSFTILSSGRIQTFTRASVLMVGLSAGYISLQLLRAIVASISGLTRRSFSVVELSDLYPRAKESKSVYLYRNCRELAAVIRENRTEIDFKVTSLAYGHRAMKNAMFALVGLLAILVFFAVSQTYS